MSKLSLYETKWTDLVFENRNKEYGAYQLRQENTKTTVSALFMALLLIAALGSLSMLIGKVSTTSAITESIPTLDDVITPVDLDRIVRPETEEAVAPPAQQQQAVTQVTQSSQLVNPVVAVAQDAIQDIATNKDNAPVVDNTSIGTGTAVNVLPTTGGNGTGGEATKTTGDGNTVVSTAILDKMPEFPGGMAKFYTYVGNNFNKPELDAERTLRVYVSFVIEKDGSMTDITVKNDPGYGLGKEAIRVLKSLRTKWTPGILEGKPVRTAYNLPIIIKTEMEQ
ncbi:energy transducer TonB [Flavobacterium chungangense]|uniref:Energy transducer TonB n=1 Tax=Flavobacterium chungangense TaxID=554283 RepID=A0A6V6Z773_9FLAO|nr:energy transducer TonB [Flavobacterium chungangense]CAD0007505.1 energy transducer TonB [Flavobacterium chungangense]